MFFAFNIKGVAKKTFVAFVVICVIAAGVIVIIADRHYKTVRTSSEKTYIKWVDFDVPYGVMEAALNYDIASQKEDVKISWVEIMALLSAKNGGNYKGYTKKDMDEIVERLKKGESASEIGSSLKYFSYYMEAYDAIFKGFVGDYKIEVTEGGQKVWQERYGLKAFSPIAKGYSFSHYDDFGNGRSFGYRRKHLGNDLMGSIGAPIVAVESGVIEVMGWNMYGGWRVGIRSFDKKRYYYYAHLRKDHPFNSTLGEGDIVHAGDVIGYLGMTGYSSKENVNNINVPHLHFGMQLIFDESQKEGVNQVWIDAYNIIEILNKNKSAVHKEGNEYQRVNNMLDPAVPD